MNRSPEQDEFLSLAALAQRWCCSRSTAERACRKNRIPAFYLSGQGRGIVRFRLRDIVSHEVTARAPTA